ncbi:MAG: hypothetical protein K6T75_00125 [Acetobacteraceae bacterium]|nr:hypothetical protein [Acetobacteraceae bacterium]
MNRAGRFSGDGELVLTRSWFGQDALYYALTCDGRTLLWADEMAAILADPAVDRRLDSAALVEEAVLGFPTGTRTVFRAVRQVPPGGSVRARFAPWGRLEVEVSVPPPPPAPERGDGPGLEARLYNAVSAAIYGGGAVLLSGGVDSTLLAVLARRAARVASVPLVAVTAISGDESSRADRGMARRVCQHLVIQGLEVMVEPAGSPLDRWCQVVRLIASPRILTGSVAAACGAVRGTVPVVLCGEGADELFAGYWWIYPHPRLYVEGLRRRLDALLRARGGEVPGASEVAARIGEWERLGNADLFRALYWMNLTERLPHLHLRTARVEAAPTPVAFPYLDPQVIDYALAQTPGELVRGGVTKRPLRDLVRALLPGGLGEAVASRNKVGLPDAAAGLRAAVAGAVAALPGVEWDSHPLRWLYPDRLQRFTADLFLYLFFCHGGHPPADFDPQGLYVRFDRDRAWREAAPQLVLAS